MVHLITCQVLFESACLFTNRFQLSFPRWFWAAHHLSCQVRRHCLRFYCLTSSVVSKFYSSLSKGGKKDIFKKGGDWKEVKYTGLVSKRKSNTVGNTVRDYLSLTLSRTYLPDSLCWYPSRWSSLAHISSLPTSQRALSWPGQQATGIQQPTLIFSCG